MKIFALLLFIPLLASAQTKVCDELGKYYKDFDKRLASRMIPNCGEFKLSESEEDAKLKDILKDVKVGSSYHENDEDKKLPFIDLIKCKDLTFIENRMRDVENQMNSLMGFKKLVETIVSSAEGFELNKVKEKEKGAAFIADVGQAALLETYVSDPGLLKIITETNAAKGSVLIDLSTPEAYKTSLKTKCEKEFLKSTLKDVCNSLVENPVSESSLLALKQLKIAYTAADEKKRNSLVASWQEELKISKISTSTEEENEEKTEEELAEEAKSLEFSFRSLNIELKSKPTETLAQMQNTIANMTKFTNKVATKGSTIEALLNRMNTFRAEPDKNLVTKRLISVHEDLYKRQKAEEESRLSLLWLHFKPKGSTEKESDKQVKILENVQKDLPPSEATHLAEALRALEATSNQKTEFEKITKCLDVDLITKKGISDLCKDIIEQGEITGNLKNLTEELRGLKRIHTEIVSGNEANEKLVKMKHLAMDALERNKCIDTRENSNISDCNIDGVLNPEMKELFIESLKISLMFIQPSEDELADAKEICEGADKSTYNSFCEIALGVETKSKKPDRSAETYTGPMDPESRNNPVRDALYNTARDVGSLLGQMIQQNKAPYYMTNGPGSYGPSSPTISGYLIGSSVASGQLKSYSSVTQNNFAYTPLGR